MANKDNNRKTIAIVKNYTVYSKLIQLQIIQKNWL